MGLNTPNIVTAASTDNAPTAFSRSANPTPNENPFVFKGNIKILVIRNGKRLEGTVSSDAMCFASPVWGKFLFPPWAVDEDSDRPKQIDFSEDDSAALLVLLNIAHLMFLKVPSWLPYKVQSHVAILCDQYDCVDLVRPWLKDTLWFKGEREESLKVYQERRLFIAWMFGRETVFEQLAAKMAMRITISAEGCSWVQRLTPMPPAIMESIFSCGKQHIESLLEIPYSLLRKFEEATHPPCCSARDPECDASTYGTVVLSLRQLGLYPRVEPRAITRSPEEVLSNLITISLVPSYGDVVTHASCYSRTYRHQVLDLVGKQEKKQFDLLLPVHRAHFQSWRLKSGDTIE